MRMTNDECRMTNVYGVVRCARNVRRRRATRMLWMIRVLRLLLWSALAGAVMCLLSGCGVQWQETGTMSGLPKWLSGSLLGLGLFAVPVFVWAAVRRQAREDEEGRGRVAPLFFAPPPAVVEEDALAVAGTGLDEGELRRIVGACVAQAKTVMALMVSADLCLEAEEYDDLMRSARDGQSMLIGCLRGLGERLVETANAEVCPPGGGV